jgi:hypothetical protein
LINIDFLEKIEKSRKNNNLNQLHFSGLMQDDILNYLVFGIYESNSGLFKKVYFEYILFFYLLLKYIII